MIEPLDAEDLRAEAERRARPLAPQQVAETLGQVQFITGSLMHYCALLAAQVNTLEQEVRRLREQ